MLLQIVDEQMHPQTWHILLLWLFVIHFIDFANVSNNGVYRIFDHMHVAFPRILLIPQIIPTNQSYIRIIPIVLKHVLRHQTNHKFKCPESYFRKIPEIIPPNHTSHATRFPDTGIFRNINLATVATANAVRCEQCYEYCWGPLASQSLQAQWARLVILVK